MPAGIKIYYLKDGQTLLPGLIEPHVHILPTAWLNGNVQIDPFDGQLLKEGYDQQSVLKELGNNLPTNPDA